MKRAGENARSCLMCAWYSRVPPISCMGGNISIKVDMYVCVCVCVLQTCSRNLVSVVAASFIITRYCGWSASMQNNSKIRAQKLRRRFRFDKNFIDRQRLQAVEVGVVCWATQQEAALHMCAHWCVWNYNKLNLNRSASCAVTTSLCWNFKKSTEFAQKVQFYWNTLRKFVK